MTSKPSRVSARNQFRFDKISSGRFEFTKKVNLFAITFAARFSTVWDQPFPNASLTDTGAEMLSGTVNFDI